MKRITQIAHEKLSGVIHLGDRVVDATVGNGHDALFLAQQVGARGEVAGFDIQTEALHATGLRLEDAECRGPVNLYELGHEKMGQVLSSWKGTVSAVVFNLGYLPGGDHNIITRSETTLPALDEALNLLKPDGVLSVMLYHGHPGGQEEMETVFSWSEQLVAGYKQELVEVEHPQAPKLLWIGKLNLTNTLH
ncbi:MAG: class I SAM-dependent methyltransferase [Verrucomicrobiota bacterium]